MPCDGDDDDEAEVGLQIMTPLVSVRGGVWEWGEGLMMRRDT